MLNAPLIDWLKTSVHSPPLLFSRIEKDRLPDIATGDAPIVKAVPLTQISSLRRRRLELRPGPSSVAVRFGASRMSNVKDFCVGRR